MHTGKLGGGVFPKFQNADSDHTVWYRWYDPRQSSISWSWRDNQEENENFSRVTLTTHRSCHTESQVCLQHWQTVCCAVSPFLEAWMLTSWAPWHSHFYGFGVPNSIFRKSAPGSARWARTPLLQIAQSLIVVRFSLYLYEKYWFRALLWLVFFGENGGKR